MFLRDVQSLYSLKLSSEFYENILIKPSKFRLEGSKHARRQMDDQFEYL